VFFATRSGTVKKTSLEAYSRPKKGGIRAILLEEGDEVVRVDLCRPGDTIILASAHGKAIRFDEKAARAMGRSSRGVRGIRLLEGDRVIGMVVVGAGVEGASLLTACRHGHGKRTLVPDYPVKGRGGQGVINIRTEGRNGDVVGVALCNEEDDVMFITGEGMIVRSPVNDSRPMGRNTQGVILVNLKEGDSLVGIAIVTAEDILQYARAGEDSAPRSPEELAAALGEVADDGDDAAPEDEDEDVESEESDEPADTEDEA